jgi:hypothetical protein
VIDSDLQLIFHHSIRASTFTRLFSAGVLHGAGLAHVGRKKNPWVIEPHDTTADHCDPGVWLAGAAARSTPLMRSDAGTNSFLQHIWGKSGAEG